MSVCMYVYRYMYAVYVCMQSPVGVYTTCRLVLSSCLVAHLSPHTAHKRIQHHKSRPSPTASPLPNPLPNPLPIHGNQEPQELKSQLSSRRNTTTGLAEYSQHRKQLQRRSIVQSHNITGGQSTAERHHIIPRTTGLHAQTNTQIDDC